MDLACMPWLSVEPGQHEMPNAASRVAEASALLDPYRYGSFEIAIASVHAGLV